MRFISFSLRYSSMLQGTYFILVESMPDKYRKAFVFILTTFLDEHIYPYWFCTYAVCAVEQRMLWDHGTVILYMPHICLQRRKQV